MIRNFKRTAAIFGVVAVGSAALVACGDSDNGTDSTATTAAEGTAAGSAEGLSGTTGQLVGEGASSQQNAMDYFGQKYGETVSGASLAYTASGSGSGRTNFVGGQVAFAGSDSPLKEDQVEGAAQRCGGNEAWHLPFVIGPVAIAYNLEGVENLNLHVDTVAKIFKGDITKWNDAEIAAENEGVDLPDTDISVVYRSDESGTTDNFQKFLGAATDIWETEGQVFPTAVGEGANGSNGVASQVAAIDGGITYVEAGFATQQGLGVANLDFGNGPVELNTESVGVALDNLQFTSEGHDMVVDTEALFASDAAGSYPLILTTYEIVCSAGYDESTSAMVKDFLTVALDNQDEGLAELGYIPVTGTHAERLAAAVEAIQ
ncbi:phosphate-binding protein [Corynebacterium humireducens NBRC 106098 = DSM 45392]|uniref:Phosphate-binding protein n=1 Tax=Corynebacterium humireducens NBRC 106098 = DSM 45392 TaxID=1223515 RepID=A0A0B5D4R9_9CORY|nr:phosphate ABC transporter substrate-binding protein PstS [Corynebacterium humireducens]AJE34010.1 phosphate-binding protein [Corynebacterium humireducens NBRC 106098 = DSM 45392]